VFFGRRATKKIRPAPSQKKTSEGPLPPPPLAAAAPRDRGRAIGRVATGTTRAPLCCVTGHSRRAGPWPPRAPWTVQKTISWRGRVKRKKTARNGGGGGTIGSGTRSRSTPHTPQSTHLLFLSRMRSTLDAALAASAGSRPAGATLKVPMPAGRPSAGPVAPAGEGRPGGARPSSSRRALTPLFEGGGEVMTLWGCA
jgi:hypothetical protein